MPDLLQALLFEMNVNTSQGDPQSIATETSIEAELKSERRERREQRRAKQRVANVDRAKTMHLARIDFQRKAHGRLTESPAATGVHVGCSGWFYWHWRNGFYPKDVPTSQWFAYYAKAFKTVELNAPFYSWPTTNTVQTWIRQIGRRKFLYTVKVSELITHVKRFQGSKTLIKDFGFIADLLGPRLGCFLFQLPPSFHFSRTALNRVVGQLDPARNNVVEFRHRSWWNPQVYKAFEKAGVTFCSCSAPGLPDELIETADHVYVRFHGKKRWYRHDYSKAELEVWAERIQRCQPKAVWVYFNNDRDLFAIKNAKQFRALLKNV
jgi:uncharacterized protein YecE (DUF72 family)